MAGPTLPDRPAWSAASFAALIRGRVDIRFCRRNCRARTHAAQAVLPRVSSGSGRPGEILGVDRDGLHIACGDGAVVIAEAQLPGRKRLPMQALCAGLKLPAGRYLTTDGPIRCLAKTC